MSNLRKEKLTQKNLIVTLQFQNAQVMQLMPPMLPMLPGLAKLLGQDMLLESAKLPELDMRPAMKNLLEIIGNDLGLDGQQRAARDKW